MYTSINNNKKGARTVKHLFFVYLLLTLSIFISLPTLAGIPQATKPDLIWQQTVKADPIGMLGTITGNLSDNSAITTVNGNTVNATTFSIQLNAGMQTLTVVSGAFTWIENIFVESIDPPKFKAVQVQTGRWCDGSNAIIMITTNRGIINLVRHAVNQVIGNDTAYITTTAGQRYFNVQSGAYSADVFISASQDESPENLVQISEVIQSTCLGSNDAQLLLSYPASIQLLSIDGASVLLNDTIKNLSEGTKLLTFTDDRLCTLDKTQEIPKSSNPCFSSSDFFSPNADGINDSWTPKVPEGSQVSFTVYAYRNLNMQVIPKKKIFEGTDTWTGTDTNTGATAEPGYYLLTGTIIYPAALNWPSTNFNEIVKLAR